MPRKVRGGGISFDLLFVVLNKNQLSLRTLCEYRERKPRIRLWDTPQVCVGGRAVLSRKKGIYSIVEVLILGKSTSACVIFRNITPNEKLKTVKGVVWHNHLFRQRHPFHPSMNVLQAFNG